MDRTDPYGGAIPRTLRPGTSHIARVGWPPELCSTCEYWANPDESKFFEAGFADNHPPGTWGICKVGCSIDGMVSATNTSAYSVSYEDGESSVLRTRDDFSCSQHRRNRETQKLFEQRQRDLISVHQARVRALARVTDSLIKSSRQWWSENGPPEPMLDQFEFAYFMSIDSAGLALLELHDDLAKIDALNPAVEATQNHLAWLVYGYTSVIVDLDSMEEYAGEILKDIRELLPQIELRRRRDSEGFR